MLSTPLVAFVGIALELSTHFVIDVAKGRITAATLSSLIRSRSLTGNCMV